MALIPPRWQSLPALIMLTIVLWVPWRVIVPAYARPAPAATLPPSAVRVEATFGESVQLVAYESSVSAVRPGESIPLTLYWRSEQPLDTDYVVFIHLLDEHDLIVAQRDVFHGPGVYPTSQWTAGEQFVDTYVLRVPRPALAPAQAHFEIGLYDHATGQRLPVSTGGDSLYFGSVEIQPQPGSLPNPQALQFEDNISLVGYAPDRQLVTAGESVTLTLYWQGRRTPSRDYKVFVHLIGPDDTRASQHDSDPQNGAALTSTWTRGQVVTDEHRLTISPDTPAGAYRTVVGLYRGDTGRRLRLLSDGNAPVQADSITLSGIRVVYP